MESIAYIVFICSMFPFLLGIPIVRGKTRTVLVFIVIGMCACLFISEVNSLVYNAVGEDMYYFTTNITPMTEELIKALPVLLFAIFISADRESLLTYAFMTGLGFALLENSTILVRSVVNHEEISILWALIRTLGAGLLHGLCTTSIGIGISFIKDRRKFFICGTFALLAMATVYHSLYNSLIQSDYHYVGAAMPLVTYILIFTTMFLVRRKKLKAEEGSKSTEEKA